MLVGDSRTIEEVRRIEILIFKIGKRIERGPENSFLSGLEPQSLVFYLYSGNEILSSNHTEGRVT
jgi:hypothetical protein